MKALPKRKGNPVEVVAANGFEPLNESPSKKEGKCGNFERRRAATASLNESPSKKEGKSVTTLRKHDPNFTLNESPSKKEGKFHNGGLSVFN